MCRSGCPTPGAHSTWGECARDAHIGLQNYLPGVGFYTNAQKSTDRELAAYRQAKTDGLQPEGTRMSHVRKAYDEAEKG